MIARLTRFTAMACAALVMLALPARAMSDVEVLTSPGGVTFWLVSEDTIPLVAMSAALPAGAKLDPEGADGLAAFTAALLFEGAGDLDATAFKQALDDRAIRLGFGVDQDHLFISLQTLSEHTDEAARLAAMALQQPRFDEAAATRVREQMIASARRAEEDPDTIAWNAWSARAWAGHPYARREGGTPESLAKLDAAAARGFHDARMTRDGARISVVGAIDAEAAGRLVDTIFAPLAATPAQADTVSDGAVAGGGETQVITREQPQSVIVFGKPGLKREDPDFIPAFVMNYMLGGGGFSSRLMDEIREKRGLTYGVGTSLAASAHGGAFVGSLSTDNRNAGEALALVRSEIARFRNDGPGEQELADAKTYLTGSFALRFDTNAKIARQLTAFQIDGLPASYVETRNTEIEAVTRDDVMRAAGRLLDENALLVVVVGTPAGITASN